MTIFLAGQKDIFAADMSELGETHRIDTGDAVPLNKNLIEQPPPSMRKSGGR